MKILSLAINLLLAATLCMTEALASVSPIGEGAFPGSALLVDFAGLTDGTEVNGLVVDGLTFSYSLGNGQLAIDGGPGTTNNITPPNIVSIGDDSGEVTIALPSAANMFGYGYAILSLGDVAAATSMSVFSGATFLGSLSFAGAADPNFTGGFAGLLSTSPFDRVVVTFNSAVATAFAMDNIRVTSEVVPPVVPEPPTILLILASLLVALWMRAPRRTARKF
jgi:hypothetical protein